MSKIETNFQVSNILIIIYIFAYVERIFDLPYNWEAENEKIKDIGIIRFAFRRA